MHSYSSHNNNQHSSDATTIEEAQILRERYSSVTTNNTTTASKILQQKAQEEAELALLEKALEQALEEHARLIAPSTTTTTTTSDETTRAMIASLERIRDCYEDLNYWEQALHIEQHELMPYYDSASSTTNNEAAQIQKAKSLHRQGKLLARMEQFQPATRLYQQAAHIYESTIPTTSSASKSPDVGKLLISMASVQYHGGRFQEALPLLHQAATHFELAGHDEQPNMDLINCLQHTGLVYRAMEDYHHSLKSYQQALQVLNQATTATEESTTTRQNLSFDIADMYAALEQYQEAIQLYQEIWDQDKAHRRQLTNKDQSPLQESHNDDQQDDLEATPLDGIVLHNLGKLHAQLGNHKLAVTQLRRAAQIKQEWLGENHSEVGKTLSALGAVCSVIATKHLNGDDVNEYKAESLQCFQQALLIARMHHAEDDPEVLLALRNVAVARGEKIPRWSADDS